MQYISRYGCSDNQHYVIKWKQSCVKPWRYRQLLREADDAAPSCRRRLIAPYRNQNGVSVFSAAARHVVKPYCADDCRADGGVMMAH